MKVRARLLGASYEPETIPAMLEAFDAAWASLRFHFYDSPDTFEAARLGLANAILLEAADDHRDVQQLKAAGLAAMAAHYRLGPGDFGLEAIMPQRVHNPKYWRSFAEETLTIAEQMKDAECKRLLVAIAQTYAELARRAIAAEKAASGRTRTDG
jgi:hypothetical protein